MGEDSAQKQNAKFYVQRSSCGVQFITCIILGKASSCFDNFYSSSTESEIEKYILNFPLLAVQWYYFKTQQLCLKWDPLRAVAIIM